MPPLVKAAWTEALLSAERLAWTPATLEDCLCRQRQYRKPLRRIDLLNQACRQIQELRRRRFGFILRDVFEPNHSDLDKLQLDKQRF